MHFCRFCQDESVEILFDLGLQPLSNRFLLSPTQHEFKHPLKLGYCQKCALVQLIDPAPVEEIRPRFNWMRFYHEPEGHLDELVEILTSLPGISDAASFCGICEIEKSMLERLKQKGFTAWQLDLKKDLGIAHPCAGSETIQKHLVLEKTRTIAKKKGYPTVIIVRRLLDHAYNPLQLMIAIRELVDKNGYIVFEVPDCTKLFKNYEYSAIWEERISYFTPYTFLKCLQVAGFVIYAFNVYPYGFEDCMVAIVKLKASTNNHFDFNEETLKAEQKQVWDYVRKFPEKCELFKKRISDYHKKGSVALLGAGHLACHFINLMGVKTCIDFVVDDHPHKKGLFMPGSQLPILACNALQEKKVKFCLMSVNPESEFKVISNKKEFLEGGGQFFSIFSTSQYALKDMI